MFQKSTTWKQIVKDKGFYVALAICLLAVGLVAALSLSSVFPTAELDGDEQSQTATTSTTAPTAGTTTTTAQIAQTPVTGVADLRTTATTTTTTTVTTVKPSEPEDLYVLPLSNEVCEPYSNGQMVYSETMGDWRTHNAVDFVGELGKWVKAAADGSVITITNEVMWGDVVEIDHGFGIVTRYCGVSARNIQVGDSVKAGQEIGVLSAIPCEAEEPTHLHLEVTSSGKPLDAVAVIGVDVRYTEE